MIMHKQTAGGSHFLGHSVHLLSSQYSQAICLRLSECTLSGPRILSARAIGVSNRYVAQGGHWLAASTVKLNAPAWPSYCERRISALRDSVQDTMGNVLGADF